MKILTLVLSFLIMHSVLIAQSNKTTNQKEQNTDNIQAQIPSNLGYKELGGFGIGIINFTDGATSPLFYKGPAFSYARAKVKINKKRESQFGTRVLLGLTGARVNDERDFSTYIGIDVYYTYLQNVPKLSFSNVDVLIGGTIDLTSIVRINRALLNNSIGSDFFPALMGSIKLKKAFHKKSIWNQVLDSPILRWIRAKKSRPAVHQEISFQADIGLINTNYRNGFAYTRHAPFFNSNNVFSDYQFHWFSGLRIRSALSYLLFSNKSKNGVKLSYNWEGIKSGSNPDTFGITSGTLQFSLIHRLY